ncbi:MAG: hypothetical protein ACE5J7_00175 [Candidatus Aenigmatarchaeota archaeon]
MKGISKEVTMNIFWIIFAIVAVMGIFIMGQFIFGLLQPIDIGAEDSGISFDGEKGTVCLDADPRKADCRRCATTPLLGTCQGEQYVNIEEKFGAVVADIVKVCTIARFSVGKTEIKYRVLYDDDKKREKTKEAYPGREVCHTFDFETGVILREVSAVTGVGAMDRFTVEFTVYQEEKVD